MITLCKHTFNRLGILGIALLLSCQSGQDAERYFKIHVTDTETGRGVPLVELRSYNKVTYTTDSQGFIAYFEPGLMDKKVYFEINSEGYSYRKDKTGRQAVTLDISPGGSTHIRMKRNQAAQRLYRLTGHGIYRESVLLGEKTPIKKPVLNANILGQDSNIGIVYNGKIFWIWGDTFLPPEYHGNFSVSAATSELPSNGGLDPAIGVEYQYFVDAEGSSKPMIHLEGPGYTWYEWLMNIPDDNGDEQLVAKYARVGGHWQNYERGIAVFNDDAEEFIKYSDSKEWLEGPAVMHHAFKGTAEGQEYFYLTSEFMFSRVYPHLDSVGDPSAYAHFTCLKEGASFNAAGPDLDRDVEGKLRYDWKRNTDGVDIFRQIEMIKAGAIRQEEAWIQIRDILSGEPLLVRRGSIFWNDYRKKWIMIAGGANAFEGEILYSEADTPVGPWVYATPVAIHDQAFYNPTQHPFFDQDGGKTIFFEGTYTDFFGQGSTIPYYDYNQIMYKLSLDHPDVRLPEPVYLLEDGDLEFGETIRNTSKWENITDIAFFSFPPDRNQDDLIPIFKSNVNGKSILSASASASEMPFCYALPIQMTANKTLPGEWDCTIQGHEAIDGYLPLNISENQGSFQVETKSVSFSVEAASFENDTLRVSVLQYGKQYNLKATCYANQLAGTWASQDGKFNGKWIGSWQGKIWNPKYSKATILINGQAIQSEQDAICRVWENPYAFPILDVETRATQK